MTSTLEPRHLSFAPSTEAWSHLRTEDRSWERLYRDRWQTDRIVRSTHGVNCTGSCSWLVHVKDGIVAWETQATDYPTNGAESPEYEPRGCPRGASFSWYVYSPLRVRYPYVRGALLRLYREELARTDDPVDAWAAIVSDPEKTREYKSRRGKGGFVRSSWDEVTEIMAAAHVHTVKQFGPDRIAGFSPIPAMSPVSYSAGTRFLGLIGGVALSFYDWYADLPPASPQVWGDQTDVPESADWWNSAYMILWGSNIPQTRTPDAHFMTEARYRGQKVVVVSPDFAGHTKFADDWLPAEPGTDAALAQAMGHVIFNEYHLKRTVPYFDDYVRRFTDMPFLVTLEERDGTHVAGRFLRASDLGHDGPNPEWRTAVLDERTGEVAFPNGSMADRWGADNAGAWNLELGDIEPVLTLLDRPGTENVHLAVPRFDTTAAASGATIVRGVPAMRIGDQLVTTVFDVVAAHLGVARDGLPGDWPSSYDDADSPGTPAWQSSITGVSPEVVIRIAREFAANAEATNGRSMIVMGAGTNHWYHSDIIYRTMLNLLLLCGCQGVNGGGWAHYVGQEKVRPIAGFGQVAFALDWARPSRQQATTPFWYLATDQWRYESFTTDEVSWTGGAGRLEGRTVADCVALAARNGWMPSYPTFNRNPLDLSDEAAKLGKPTAEYIVDELEAGRLRFAAEDPDAPENFPRVLTQWRANLIGSSSKGQEYFLRHLLGVPNAAIRNEESPPEIRPAEVEWHDEAPEGKLDLFTTIDFRMNGSCLYSDIVLPAATWYEKNDVSSTDLHPFVHTFGEAVPPPWEARTDFDAFRGVAERFSELAKDHLGTRTDVVAAPLAHDSPDEIAQVMGEVVDWKNEGIRPVPGITMPKLIPIERDYTAVGAKWAALGPLVETGIGVKGWSVSAKQEAQDLADLNGIVETGPCAGRPKMTQDVHWADAIFAMSGTTNARIATAGFRAMEQRSGVPLADLGLENAEHRITFRDARIQPRKVMTSPEWSGLESRERRYNPFTMNVDRLVPWRTLTGRQQFYVDHAWMLDMGEGVATYRPPVNSTRYFGDLTLDGEGGAEVVVRWLSPHSKWSIHSEYQDNLHMLTLFRGGPVVWMSTGDAERIGAADNDWVDIYNRHGVIACRAVVSHRIPDGVALMYHSQDRHVNVPISDISETRGGTDNSVTRISIKPSHLIGGYAQLSYGFNYYGPTGSQRDELTVIRRRRSEVRY